jgi:hypothetical protein
LIRYNATPTIISTTTMFTNGMGLCSSGIYEAIQEPLG